MEATQEFVDPQLAARAASARAPLLHWYDKHRRDLPWRRRNDGYAIMVSEFMLQQTRSETVARYFDGFLNRFPSVEVLAASEEDEVVRAWSGLGYYRRARFLWLCAKAVVAAGSMPKEASALRQLPGIGAYTAAAISSIAFARPSPAVDGNVERVLSRWQGIELPIKSAAGQREVRRVAAALLARERPGDWNQALMELGATLCRAPRAECGACPLQTSCRSRGTHAALLPISTRRRVLEREEWMWIVARQGNRLLLEKREHDAPFLAGFWQLPQLPNGAPRDRWPDALEVPGGGRWSIQRELGRFAHAITYRRIVVRLFEAESTEARFGWCDTHQDEVAEGSSEAMVIVRGTAPRQVGWFTPAEIHAKPRSAMLLKALAILKTDR